MKNRYRCAIIGCGQMGTFFSQPDDWKGVLTHAHAYRKEERTELVAFVDTDKKKAKMAQSFWGGNAYTDLRQMFRNKEVDIVSVCTPEDSHAEVLKNCLLYRPKLVFCEKPLATSYAIAERIVEQYQKAGVLLAVNFSRRWNPLIVKFREEVRSGAFGKVVNIVGVYAKGILHNGSHLVDTLVYLFGEVQEAKSLAARQDWSNRNDPTLDAFLKFKNGTRAHLVAANERKYSIFDIYLYFEKACFAFEDFSDRIIEYRIKESRKAAGYKELQRVSMRKGGNDKLILDAVKNLVNALEGKEELRCSGKDALEAQKVCQSLIENSKRRK